MSLNSPIADRITAAVFFALGGAMAWGGLVMDRLEIRQIHPASIPGLVPMILGVALMFCAVLLFAGAREKASGNEEPDEDASWGDFGVAAVWSAFYAVALIGRVPFAAATAVYITLFLWWFTRPAPGRGGAVRAAALAVVFGVTFAAAVSALFRYGFLVRLP